MQSSVSSEGKIVKIAEKQYQKHLDTIQVIVSHPDRDTGIFFTGGWDGNVKAWRASVKNRSGLLTIADCSSQHLNNYSFEDPVLSISVSFSNLLFIGLSSGVIMGGSLENEKIQFFEVTRHNAGIVYLTWVNEFNFLMSFGMNEYLIINQMGQNGFQEPKYIRLPEKTVCANFSFPYLVICGLKSVRVYDIRNFDMNNLGSYDQIIEDQESKINCVAINYQRRTIAIGTIDSKGYIFQFHDDGSLKFDNKSKSHHIIELSKRSYSVSMSKIQKNLVSSVQLIYTQGKQGHLSVCFGCNRRLYIYSLPGKDELKALKTYRQLSNVTAMKYQEIGGVRLLIIATGNNWENGIQSLTTQTYIALEAKQIISKDLGKYLNSF